MIVPRQITNPSTWLLLWGRLDGKSWVKIDGSMCNLVRDMQTREFPKW